MSRNKGRFPAWLKRRVGARTTRTQKTLDRLGAGDNLYKCQLSQSGRLLEPGDSTILILGNICTRNCRFCSVGHGKPKPPDKTEPRRAAALAKELNLKYLVITSVDRDDLPDGGAGHFRDVVQTCRLENPGLEFELLAGDFRGCQDQAAEILSAARPFIFGHNLETVPRCIRLHGRAAIISGKPSPC